MDESHPKTGGISEPSRGAADAGPGHDPGRRDFLRSGASLGIAATLTTAAILASKGTEGENLPAAPATRAQKRRLGKSGLEIPPVSFGTFALRDGDAELVRAALDRGVTHFDTADSYGDGAAESTLGRALSGDRGRVTLTTKHAAAPGASADDLMRELEASLRRLRTDTIDLYMNHAVDSFDRLRNPGWAEFVMQAKQAGKIRAAGMSGHGPSLVPILHEAIESDWLDAVLVAYNYIQTPSYLSQAKLYLQRMSGRIDWVSLQPELPGALAKARARDIGVMTMKTLRGARHNDLRPFERDGSTFAQAAIRWVLAQDDVDGIVITMRDVAQVEEFVAAYQPSEQPSEQSSEISAGGLTRRPEDLALLVGYESLNYSRQCIQGCGDCSSVCPAGVPISETLRLSMYARDYHAPEIARREYEALKAPAEACLGCSGAPCADACASGVAIPTEMRDAHRRLTG